MRAILLGSPHQRRNDISLRNQEVGRGYGTNPSVGGTGGRRAHIQCVRPNRCDFARPRPPVRRPRGYSGYPETVNFQGVPSLCVRPAHGFRRAPGGGACGFGDRVCYHLSAMAATKITIKNNGSIRIEGDFTLHDATGAEYGLGGRQRISLCRCGHSETKPFCDGSHRRHGFVSECTAYDMPPLEEKP